MSPRKPGPFTPAEALRNVTASSGHGLAGARTLGTHCSERLDPGTLAGRDYVPRLAVGGAGR